jgi:hypothetical protein
MKFMGGKLMLKRLLLLASIPLIITGMAFAQQGSSGALNGVVTDASGAAIPGATVVVTELTTNIAKSTVTTGTGNYAFPALPPGLYKIAATHIGFSPNAITQVPLRVAQLLTVDVKLVAGATETVEVSTDAQLLESGTAQLSHYASGEMLETLPVPVSGDGERQLQDFLFKSLPGTTGETYVGSINGGQNLTNEVYLDGISMGTPDTAELAPSLDAIGDFNMQTGSMGAQYNGGGTAVSNFSVKSGGNKLHGSLYEYLQNEDLNANSYDSNYNGTPRPKQRLNNFGGTVSGPVFIPKLYDGRDKTFFFFSYEGTRKQNFIVSGLTTMPTQPMLTGDLSGFLNPAQTGDNKSGQPAVTTNPDGSTSPVVDVLGRQVVYGQIYDPNTQRILTTGQVDPLTGLTAKGNGLVREPFANNQIPTGRFDPVAQNYLKLKFPTNFINGKVVGNLAEYGQNQPEFTQNDYTFKIDQNIGKSQRVDFYFTTNERYREISGAWSLPGTNPLDGWNIQDNPGKLVRANDYWTISPSFVNHFGIGYNRFTNKYTTDFSSEDWASTLGIQNVPSAGFPTIGIGGNAAALGSEDTFGSNANGSGSVFQSTIFVDTLSITHGRHQLQVGTEWRYYNQNQVNLTGLPGFNFSSSQTDDGLSATKYTGNGFASFLLGQVASESSGVFAGSQGYRRHEIGTFVQDDWRVNSHLTINAGLRWEIISPYSEVHGQITNLDTTLPNPGAGNQPGALEFASQLGRKTFEKTEWGYILPRIGFAYAANPRFVWRGGFGVNSQSPEGAPAQCYECSTSNLGYTGQVLVSQATNPTPSPDMAVTTLSTPYPAFTGTLPNYDPTQLNYQGAGSYVINPNGAHVEYVENYNFGFQYDLGHKTVAEMNYVGNVQRRMWAYGTDQLNQLPFADLAKYGDALGDPISEHPEIPLPYASFPTSYSVAQAVAPFPQYLGGNVSQYESHNGWSRYDALQATITHNVHPGLSVIAAYTWSKTLTNANSAYTYNAVRDIYNLRAEKALAIGLDVPQQFKLTLLYDLPFGKGRQYALHGPLDWVAGGWTLSANAIYQSGDVLQVSDSGVTNGLFSTTTPNYTGMPIELKKSGQINENAPSGPQYLNPAGFTPVQTTCSLVAPNTPCNNIALATGNVKSAVGAFGPGLADENISLQKNFSLGQRTSFQLRVDANNVFNRAGRGDPVGDINSPQFGQIIEPGTDQQDIDSDSYFYQPRVVQLSARIKF